MKPGQIGIAIFVIALLVVGGYAVSGNLGIRGAAPAPATVPAAVSLSQPTGYLGGEKEWLMADPEVRAVFAGEPYRLDPRLKKKGSVAMVRDPALKDEDCLWPSDDVAQLIYNARPDRKVVRQETIFYSPLVIYSWDEVTDALLEAGVVEQTGESYYVDMPKLVALIEDGATWESLGVDQTNVSGRVTVFTSDPTLSNSGNMFFGLLATALNDGVVPDEASIEPILPQLQELYRRLGTMPESSADIFDSFMKTGMGAKPLMAGYESQVIGYAAKYPRDVPAINEHVRILYPKPTVWSSHPLIARNATCATLIDALKDDRVQTLAWERYGFRTGTVGTQNPKALPVSGIPERIGAIVVRPSVAVVDRIVDTLSGRAPAPAPAATPS